MSSMLGGEHVSEEFAAFVHKGTEGVPLLVEESVRLMHARADLARGEAGWVRRRLADIEVPPTVRDATLERVRRLDPAAQAVLRAAVVLAEPAGEALLAAVSGLSTEDVRAGLTEALRCGLLGEDDRGVVAFRHVLAGRAVYESVPGPERRSLHARAGHALERVRPVPVARLARHFRNAGETGLWLHYADQAADLALAAGDLATAVTLLHGLLTQAELPADVALRLLGKIPSLAVTSHEQSQSLVRALRHVLDRRPDRAAEIRAQLGRALMQLADYDAARAELEQAVHRLPPGSTEAARTMVLLGFSSGSSQSRTRALHWLRRAGAAIALLPPDEQLPLQVDRVYGLLQLGAPEGWADVAGLPEDPAGPAQRLQLTRLRGCTAFASLLWGRYAQASRHLAKAFELAEAGQYWQLHRLYEGTQDQLDWVTGNWAGLATRTRARADDEETLPVLRNQAALVAGLLAAAAGEPGQAEQLLRPVLEWARASGAVEFFVEPAAALAGLRLAAGRPEEALDLTDEPISRVAAQQLWIWATEIAPARVEALVAANRADEAAALVETFGRKLRGLDAPAPQAALVLCRAMLTAGRGQPDRAATLFARAAQAWQVLPRPYDALLARERQAGCLVRAARTEAALPVLSQVFTGLADLGARGDAIRVMHTLRGHGVEVKRPWWGGRRGYGDQLSPRELDVVRLLLSGGTNRDIAAALYLSPKTVAGHVDAAMRKLRVTSRTALAVRAVEAGIVPGEVPDAG